jgi:hypothetical protein
MDKSGDDRTGRRVYRGGTRPLHRSDGASTGRGHVNALTGRRRYAAMHSSLIGKVEKANRYARELDRITIDRLSLTFRGDNDTHHVSLDAGQWHCTCHYFESWASCVHLLTLQKIMGVMLPEEAQVSIFAAQVPASA